jgi:hypothetical protein
MAASPNGRWSNVPWSVLRIPSVPPLHRDFSAALVQFGVAVRSLSEFGPGRRYWWVVGRPAAAMVSNWSSVGALQSLVHPTRHLPKRVRLLRDFLTDQLVSACPKQ